MSPTNNLVKWLIDSCPEKQRKLYNDFSPEMQLNKETGDRVLVTTKAIKKGAKFPVPPPCILSESTVANSVVGKMFSGLDVYSLFALFLIVEKHDPKSFWKPYLDMLPTNISFHPITYLAKDNAKAKKIIETEQPTLLRALEAQSQKLNNEWDKVGKLVQVQEMLATKRGNLAEIQSVLNLFKSGKVSYTNDFLWANCMVISRAFKMKEPDQICMVPLADSMNHSSDPTVLWRPKLPRGFFIVSVQQDVEAGQELNASYHGTSESGSAMDVLKQFLMYGFSEDEKYQALQASILGK